MSKNNQEQGYKIVVYIKTNFEGFHRYVDAPEEVKFLRNWHRHLFHVKLGIAVTHGNRETEFFILLKQVQRYIEEKYKGKHFESSCEMIAQDLLIKFDAEFVEVSEDDENGAIVSRT